MLLLGLTFLEVARESGGKLTGGDFTLNSSVIKPHSSRNDIPLGRESGWIAF